MRVDELNFLSLSFINDVSFSRRYIILNVAHVTNVCRSHFRCIFVVLVMPEWWFLAKGNKLPDLQLRFCVAPVQ